MFLLVLEQAAAVVRVDDVLACLARIKVSIALRGIIKRDHLDVDRVSNLDLIVEDRLHQIAVVGHHRALTRHERVRLGPAEAEAHRKRTDLRVVIDAARVGGDVETGDTDRATLTDDVHAVVEDLRRDLTLRAVSTVATGLEADAVNRTVLCTRSSTDAAQHRRVTAPTSWVGGGAGGLGCVVHCV
eukprot:SAG31_NODE_4286_length_3378_cov_6.692894_2_plen_186_part_00